jgi:hypothetical protein
MNIANHWARSSALLALLLATTCNAADLPVCPPRLAVNQNSAASYSGWQNFASDEKHAFVGVSFSEGPPDQKVTLVPSKQKKNKGGSVATWGLTPSNEGYWVACLYAQTSMVVAQKLPADTTQCEVEYDGRFASPVAKNWRCSSAAKPKP